MPVYKKNINGTVVLYLHNRAGALLQMPATESFLDLFSFLCNAQPCLKLLARTFGLHFFHLCQRLHINEVLYICELARITWKHIVLWCAGFPVFLAGPQRFLMLMAVEWWFKLIWPGSQHTHSIVLMCLDIAIYYDHVWVYSKQGCHLPTTACCCYKAEPIPDHEHAISRVQSAYYCSFLIAKLLKEAGSLHNASSLLHLQRLRLSRETRLLKTLMWSQ